MRTDASSDVSSSTLTERDEGQADCNIRFKDFHVATNTCTGADEAGAGGGVCSILVCVCVVFVCATFVCTYVGGREVHARFGYAATQNRKVRHWFSWQFVTKGNREEKEGALMWLRDHHVFIALLLRLYLHMHNNIWCSYVLQCVFSNLIQVGWYFLSSDALKFCPNLGKK